MAISASFEFNETLQITKEQGFPMALDLDQHLRHPYTIDDVIGKIYEFHDKPRLRNFAVPPIRCFFVENRDGKWIYR
jgi:hypothetical protein